MTTLVSLALLTGLGLKLGQAGAERKEEALSARILEEARAFRVGEALALLEPLDEERTGPMRRLLLEGLVAQLRSRAEAGSESEDAVEQAHRVGDELIAAHGDSWPELVRALEPIVAGLRVRRELARLAAPLRLAAAEAGVDIEALEARFRAAASDARRLGDEAAREFARSLGPVWEAALISAARSQARQGRPVASAATLRRAFPFPEASAPISSPALSGSEAPAPIGTPEEQLAALEAALAARDLDRLRSGVALRTGSWWSAESSRRLEELLPRACGALASVGAERASEASAPDARLILLLAAVTCDELLPAAFLQDALEAIALERVAWAEAGGELPAPAQLAGRDELLARLACEAGERADSSAERAALLSISSQAMLEAALSCGRWDAPSPERPRAPWPSLDYPSATLGSAEDRR